MNSKYLPLVPVVAATSLASLISVSVMAAEPAALRVGYFDVVPTLSVEERHDNNIFSQADNEKASWVTVVSPAVQAKLESENTELTLVYQLIAGQYASSHSDDYYDNKASADFVWALNHRNQIELSASYYDGHEDRGTGFSEGAGVGQINSPDTFEERSLGVNYTLGGESSRGRLVLSVENFEKEYTNHRELTRTRDRDTLSSTAAFFWNVGGRTELLIEANRSDIDYTNDPASVIGGFDSLDSEEDKYLVGVVWEATGKTQGSVKVGRSNKQFDDADRDDSSNSSWEAELHWAPKTYSVLSFTTSKENNETNGTGSFIDSELYGVNWRHDWSDRASTNLFYNLQDDNYEDDVEEREDDLSSYGVRFDYELRRWIELGISAVYSERDSNLARFDYERTQVALHLSFTL